MKLYDNNKNIIYDGDISSEQKLGSGCEVVAYQINDQVFKIHKDNPQKQYLTEEAIEKLKNIKTRRILLPNSAIFDEQGKLLGYKMKYINDLGIDNYFHLNRKNRQKENKIIKKDLDMLSDNHVELEDLIDDNTVYNNGLYLIDPGSYVIFNSKSVNQIHGINIVRMNDYLLTEVLKSYVLLHDDYSKSRLKAIEHATDVSLEVRNEYQKSGKDDVLEFFSHIKEDTLADFVENRVGKKK